MRYITEKYCFESNLLRQLLGQREVCTRGAAAERRGDNFKGLIFLLGSQGQNLALTVLYVQESGLDCLICARFCGLDCLMCARFGP